MPVYRVPPKGGVNLINTILSFSFSFSRGCVLRAYVAQVTLNEKLESFERKYQDDGDVLCLILAFKRCIYQRNDYARACLEIINKRWKPEEMAEEDRDLFYLMDGDETKLKRWKKR